MSDMPLPSHLLTPPTGPFEVLIPEKWTLSEPPRFGGKVISYLAISLRDSNSIEFDAEGRVAHSTDRPLHEYLDGLVKDGQLTRAIQHCRAMMHSSGEEGAIGFLGAVQQEWAYTFHVFEQATGPNTKWELRRRVRLVQTETPEPQVTQRGLLARLKQCFTRK